MKSRIRFVRWLVIVISLASACSSPALTVTPTPAASPIAATPLAATTEALGVIADRTEALPTATTPALETVTPEPSLTPGPVVLDLEIIEWSEWPYASPADPANTDTHVEVLIRNPNNFPVKVNTDADELRFRNVTGDVVYTNPSSFFYIWQGEWMLPGETAALSACVCFWSSGLAKQNWESLELIAPLEIATDVAYTADVEVTLGEFFNLADAHLGGNALGAEVTLTNASDQELESIPVRVLARDASGRFVGVAMFGNSVASFTERINIQPGDTATGIMVSDIDYIDLAVPLTYEVAAIGILAPAAATQPLVLPSGIPIAEWEGIPIMPGAISGDVANDGYQFTTRADLAEIASYYKVELSNLGFELEVSEDTGYAVLAFSNGGTSGVIAIAALGDLNVVQITVSD